MTIQTLSASERDIFKVVQVVMQLCQGRNNSNGVVTLTPGASSTVVQAPNCATGATPLITPTTANAAAEFGNGTIYVGTIANGSFTINHANGVQIDRTYVWAVIG